MNALYLMITLSISEAMLEVWSVVQSIGQFFVIMWNDEDRWWCIGGLIVMLIMLYKIIIRPILMFFGWGYGILDYSNDTSHHAESSSSHKSTKRNMAKVTIKGVYQMNGPKPFTREIECSSAETGYYSQLMGNKSKQAQWIAANFPGANTDKGFSMSVNIK